MKNKGGRTRCSPLQSFSQAMPAGKKVPRRLFSLNAFFGILTFNSLFFILHFILYFALIQ